MTCKFFLGLTCFVGANLAAFALETDRNYGEASYQFLKLPLSPRITALGGAGIALWDGSGEAESNPAAAAEDAPRLTLGYGLPFSEFAAKASHIVWNIPWDSSRIWLGARYLGFDPITGHDELDVATTSYTAHTLKVQAGYALTWRDLRLGLALGYAQNHLAEATYHAGLASVGARYDLWRGLSLGAAATNADFWASDARETGNAAPFPPTTVQAGVAWKQVLPRGFEATLAADARTRNDEQIVFPLGLEVTWNKAVTVRAGYPIAAKSSGPSGGLAIGFAPFLLQYAYESHADLSGGHYMSLALSY
jgi:hypothetical protein